MPHAWLATLPAPCLLPVTVAWVQASCEESPATDPKASSCCTFHSSTAQAHGTPLDARQFGGGLAPLCGFCGVLWAILTQATRFSEPSTRFEEPQRIVLHGWRNLTSQIMILRYYDVSVIFLCFRRHSSLLRHMQRLFCFCRPLLCQHPCHTFCSPLCHGCLCSLPP